MSVIISVFYPLWYRSYRMRIKEILETDVIAAKTLLDIVTAEHDTITEDIEEDLHLHHAKEHLDALNFTGQSQQKNATIDALNEK